MRAGHLALAAALVAVLAAALVAAEPGPRFDPFARPDARRLDGQARGKSDRWSPTLLATLVDGSNSLVNFGGEVVRLGEESHGYRLLEVREWEAVFDRGGEVVTLQVEHVGRSGSR